MPRLVTCYDGGLLDEILRDAATHDYDGSVAGFLSDFGAFINIVHMINYYVAFASPVCEHQ